MPVSPKESNLTLDVRKVSDKASIIDVRGDITAACEDALMAAYAGASGPQTRAIVLNFTGLEYMNSSGIGLLVTLLVRANRQKQRIFAFGLNEHYRQILELTRLDEAIGIHEDEPAALAAAAAARP
jgi:anti-sigma B factor antagonist